MKIAVAILVLVVSIMASATRYVSAGLMTIDDGGFEGLAMGVAPYAPATQVRGAWTMQNQARISTSAGNPGQSMNLESGGSAASDPLIYQDVTGLTPGTAYSVGWDLRVAVNYGGSYVNGPSFGVFLDTQTFASALYLGGTLSTSYVPFSTTFVATSTTHRLFFAGELDSRTNGADRTDVSYYLDNVSFTPVPEPRTFAMLGGIALMALGYAWRRRVNLLSVFSFFLSPFSLKSRITIMKTRFVLLILTVVVLCQVSQALAKTFVIPHVLEKSGTINNTPFSFDTTIFADYVGTDAPTANLYLYDRSTGGLMTGGTGTNVADPYTLSFDTATKKASVRVDDLITAHGGFSTPVKTGFGIIVLGGADPDNVAVQGFVVNSHTSQLDLAVFGFEPEPIQASVAKRSFVLPHVLEKAGKTGLAGNPGWGGCTDTLLYPTYVGGLLGVPESSATLQLTLFNNDGSRMFSDGEAFDYQTVLDSGNRSPLVCLEDIIQDRGGFGGAAKEGYLAVSITGDAGNVAIQGFVVNSHTNPLDLTFSPVPEPGTLSLVGIIGVCLGGYVWRRRRQAL